MIRISLLLLFFFTYQITSSQTTTLKYLSGTDKDHTVLWDFNCSAGRNNGTWSKIPVPSCWELQGFGSYHYGWEENFKQNESGQYKFNFQRDPSWKNKTVRIVFEGSMTDTEVRVNEKLAGPVHQGSFYRFKYDITKLLRDNNNLDVKVSKISTDTSVNRAERMSDFWVFGGIYRPVYLEILPKEFIDWTAIDARADGTFSVNVYLENITGATDVEAQIKTMQGELVGRPFSTKLLKNQSKVILKTQIDNPQLWNPETPHRYQVEIRLKKQLQDIHVVTEKFGFRTVVFKEGSGFYVNDTKVIFKGSNRHSFWPTSGRTTSKDLSVMDIQLMKEMNMNAVRMSHYPPDVHFLDACDSMGLFVLDELTGWQKKYDTPVGKRLVREMVTRDVNHPSIVIWDNGNEGGNNHDLVEEYAKYDPQNRKVIHPWNVFQGTDTQHYKGYDCCVGSLNHGSNVFFPTEILHGLYDGGHGAGLDDHWSLMEKNPLFAGVFLWAFADEGIVRHDLDSIIDIKGNLAPDGIVGPYREKEGSFFTIKEIWSPVRIKEEKLAPDFDGTLTIENKYLYTTLDKVRFEFSFLNLPDPALKTESLSIIESGYFTGPPILPGEFARIKIPTKSTTLNADVLYLTAKNHSNQVIMNWSWPLKSTKDRNRKNISAPPTTPASATLVGDVIQLQALGIAVSINTKTGTISDVKNNGSSISLTNGPTLVIGTSSLNSLKHYQNGQDYIIEIKYTGELQKIKYTMQSNGLLKIDYAYSLYNIPGSRLFDFMGISFRYPEEKIIGVRYAGHGPYRVWKNRMKGNQFGIWNKKYNNTVTGESWEYPEFKGYYRDFQWVVIDNKEQPFTILTENDNLFLRLFTPAKPKGAKNNNAYPEFPDGDISVLHAINSIGTKFDGPENHGPSGEKNKIGWDVLNTTLYFDFRDH
jgi:hypothetical protein